MSNTNDFNTVVIRKNRPSSARITNAGMNSALRSGSVESVKKFAGGSNSQTSVQRNTAKLDAETDELSHQRVSTDLKKAIVQGRTAKGMTQAQVSQAINEKPQTIQEYESGKAIPNNQVLGKLERVLGCKLRGNLKK